MGQGRERSSAGHIYSLRPAPKIRFLRQRIREPSPVGLLWHFCGAESGKVRRYELRVEQAKATI